MRPQRGAVLQRGAPGVVTAEQELSPATLQERKPTSLGRSPTLTVHHPRRCGEHL
ncbi:hypothetical protein [Pseudonocardia yunnanensis]|uniref:Uncharacterized protein n=1 Tax=Pseudonocardia yunnanensis TaxID=58107 RepID=A0ABW4F732_9PSEU